jgi:hypothetical protein
MTRWCIVFCSVLAACSRAPIDLPEHSDAKSVVLLIERSVGSAVDAHALDAPSRSVDTSDAEEVRALFYRETLAELGLEEGTVPPYAGADGRRLPGPEYNYLHDSGTTWSAAVLEDSELYRTFRLPPEGLKLCATNGGCYPNTVGATCVRPCERPAEPFPPMIPEVILPQLGPCPAGWTAIARSGITICEPRVSESCAPDTHPFLGGGCAMTAPACDLSSWPVVDPAREVLWVRGGGSGSGSTQNEPLGSIGAALVLSNAGAQIAIAPGRYRESLLLQDGRELLGACPLGVVLEGALEVGRSTLRSLSVQGSVRVTERLVLEAVEVSSPETALWIEPGAELLSSRAAIAGATAVRLDRSARAEISGSVLSGETALVMTSATATVASTYLAGLTAVSAGELRLYDSELLALTATASAFVGAERIVVRGAETAVLADPARLSFRRAWVEPTGTGFRLLNGSNTTLEDVYLTGPAAAFGVFSKFGAIVARRMLVENFQRGFAVESTNLLVSASTIRGGLFGVTCGDDAEVRVETSLIEGTADYALRVSGTVNRPGDTYQFADLRLENNAGGILMVRTQVGRVERVVIRGAMREGMQLGRLPDISPTMFAEDVVIEDTQVGVYVVVGSINLDGFVFRNIRESAFRVEEPADTQLTHGLIADLPVAFQVYGSRRDPRSLLTDVLLESVPVVCSPCGGL